MPENNLNLPKTAFSMKANLPSKEPKILESWEKTKLYERLRKKSAGKEKFILQHHRYSIPSPFRTYSSLYLGYILLYLVLIRPLGFKTSIFNIRIISSLRYYVKHYFSEVS